MPIQTTKKWFMKYSAILGYVVTALGAAEVALAPLAPSYPVVGAVLVGIGVLQVGAAAINQHIDEMRTDE